MNPNSAQSPSRMAGCFRAAVTLTLAALVAASCGGGSGGSSLLSGVGSGGTGSGVITGFGSLVLDGVRRNDAGARYTSEATQAAAVSVPLTSAVLGQSAEYAYDASGNVSSVLLSPELVGPVSAATGNSVTILGTSVVANADPALGPVTHFVGYDSLAGIKVGDKVEVHGHLKTDGPAGPHVQASLIMRKTALAGVRLSGVVAQFKDGAGSFALGGATIVVGSAPVSPQGLALANGQLVTVWSDGVPSGSTLTAAAIRIKRPSAGSLTLSGPVASFAGLSNFQVGSASVDASAAVVSPAGSTLSTSSYVTVAGSYAPASNRLTATSVTVVTAAVPTTVELHGSVESYVSAASFAVRGVTVDASAASFVKGTATQLANGVYLEIHGTVSNNIVRAATVDIQALSPTAAPSGALITVAAVISGYNAVSGTYAMSLASGGSMSCTMAADVDYVNGGAAKLVTGQAVTITGTVNGATLASKVVNFQSSPTPSADGFKISGVAYNVGPTSFMVNGLTIQSKGVVVGGEESHGSLSSGSRVEVEVKLVAGQYVATGIELDAD